MSSFFTLPASQRKRKRTEGGAGRPVKRRSVQVNGDESRSVERTTRKANDPDVDESISGSETEENVETESAEESEATSEEEETAADRRIRLAQRYLDNIREEVDEVGFDAEEVDRDLVAQRLKEDADEVRGRQFRTIATSLDLAAATICRFRTKSKSTTAVAIRPPFAYTASKDKVLTKWALVQDDRPATNGMESKTPSSHYRKPRQLARVQGIKVNASATKQHGHTNDILSLAVSADGKYIATGGKDKQIVIWAAETLLPLKTFFSHRDSVTGLSFAPASSQPGVGSQLFSASMDRTLKTYSLNGDDSLAYVETLFGHQDHVVSVAAMGIDQCVSVGGRDRTARLWKVVDETQLVFRADSSRNDSYTTGTVDCVAAVPPAHFVTGSDSGSISLWSKHKKKPVYTIQTAHGVEQPLPLEEVSSETHSEVLERLKKNDRRRPAPRYVTALATIPGTDVVLSGSWDGWIRAWKVADDKRTLLSLGVVGQDSTDQHPKASHGHGNGKVANGDAMEIVTTGGSQQPPHTERLGPVRGVINSIAVHERRTELQNEFGGKKEGETLGLSVLAGTGKDMRLGRWREWKDGWNGAVLIEVPVFSKQQSGGMMNQDET